MLTISHQQVQVLLTQLKLLSLCYCKNFQPYLVRHQRHAHPPQGLVTDNDNRMVVIIEYVEHPVQKAHFVMIP